MSLENIQNYTQKETEQFRSVCNQLLSRTFVIRTLYTEKGRINNPDYSFITTHFEDIRDYLFLLNWDMYQDDFRGYYFVQNADEANRCDLGKNETAILLALRMIYEENQERIGLEHDVICTVRDVLEKVVTDYAILPARPNMDEVKRAMKKLDDHSVIQHIDGKYNQADTRFAILPTILTVVSSERMNAVVSVLRKEDESEEAQEDPAD